MKLWFNYLFALLMAMFSFFSDTSDLKLIYSLGVFLISLASVLVVDLIVKKVHIQSIVWYLGSLVLTLALLGLSYPLFAKLPFIVFICVCSFFLCSVFYAVFLYCHNINTKTPIKSVSSSIINGVTEPVKVEKEQYVARQPRILDTSIVIDGRIIEIVASGFMEGPFVVPNFVLREIQLISDSPDSIKRSRGRRGLDMLQELQKGKDMQVDISYQDYPDTREVDAKLIRLAKDLNGILVTNDFNLNKVAKLQGLTVWNMNTLTNALKPVVLPGEEMEIEIIKEGKDENQGIGYLEDGTMVVVENARRLKNKKVKVTVTSVIQTNAGKMIFTKTEHNSHHNNKE